MKKYALLSVFDKTNISDIARKLVKAGYSIISTGGTAKVLTDAKIPVIPIQEITGNPESFDGRMKTISFQIEAGILFDRAKKSHQQEAKKLKISAIDIVICNLYPFEKTVSKPSVTHPEAIESIDVGGPTMIRAAAKNYFHVLVVTDPGDYPAVISEIRKKTVPMSFKLKLAAKAFHHLAFYDGQVAHFLGNDMLPAELPISLRKDLLLRYGDNPDQIPAQVYFFPWTHSPVKNLQRLTGREPSATNITDIDAGIRVVRLFTEPAAVVIKHNTPCGIALGSSPEQALMRALDADPESAFGGVVVLNIPTTEKAARQIAAFKEAGKGQMDVIASPAIEDQALALLKTIRKTTGIYIFGKLPSKKSVELLYKAVDGGFILQPQNDPEQSFPHWEVVTKKAPSKKQLEQMKVSWKFLARTRSNTIIIVDKTLPMTRGIGTGQTSRVLAAKIALERAGVHTIDSILASDSFFPFDDSVRLAAKAGIRAIVQQGGSLRDHDSIVAADKAGLVMIFTHQRLFWH